MTVPTTGANLVSVGSIAAGTTLAIVLTAAVPVGDVLIIAVSMTASQTTTATDSKGNTYVNETGVLGNGPNYCLMTCLVTKALAIADTITITFGATVQGAAAGMLQLTGVPQNQVGITSYAGVGSSKSGVSTSASSNALATTKPDDCIFLFLVGTYNGSGQVLSTDFSLGSVNNSYTIADYSVSAGGTAGCGICLCYKTVVATPASQSPTFTLNASRTWNTNLIMLSGLNARGAVGINFRIGDIATNSANYVPHSNDVLGKLNYNQVGKTLFDGFPKPVITPQEPKIGQQVSDGLLTSD